MSELLKIKEGESSFEHKVRLCLAKLNKEIDLDWVELVELLGLDCSGDHLRKLSYAYKEYSEYMDNTKMENTVEEDDFIKQLETKKIELEKERKKLQTEKLEYNKMLREQAREELIVEHLRDIIPGIEPPTFYPIISDRKSKKEYVLCFGDIHYDKFFESVNNKYSIDEIHRRFQVLLEETIEIIQKENITKLHIVNCGDSLEGLLRISAIKTMRLGLLESVIQFSRFMAEWLNSLSQFVEIVYVHVPTANHSELRMFNQKAGETDENLERIIVNYIHDLLRDNERVTVPITTDRNYVSFELMGFNFIVLHGDGVKNIKNSLKDLSLLHRKFYDYCIMGHFHSGMETTVAEGYTNNMEVIVIPSIVGSDTYSDSLMVGSKSSAKMLVFSDKGHTQSYNIILN